MKPSCTLLAAALLLAGGAASAQTGAPAAQAAAATSPAQAAAPAPADDLQEQVKQLKAELEALKAAQAAAASRLDEAEVRSKDAVVAGDIPGSFRVPGTEISLRLYGFAELNWVHGFKGDSSDIDYASFAPYIPLDGSDQARRKNRDYLTARTSRLGLEAGTPTRFGVLQVKLEGDFNNEPRTGGTAQYATYKEVYTQQVTSSYGFRVRQAYGQFGGLLAGMTWSTFMDVDNFPETVDYNGPIGNTFIRQPVLRYTYGTTDKGNFIVALENSSSYILDGRAGDNLGFPIANSLSRLPDLVLRWEKGFDWGSASLRAVTDEIRFDDGTGLHPAARGYGVGASALLKTWGDDYTVLAVTYGDGIGRYLNYIEGAAYEPGAGGSNGKIRVERAIGLVAGYQWKPRADLRVNAVYGMTHEFDNDYTKAIRALGLNGGRFGVNRTVQAGHLGAIYTPVKSCDLGLEGVWGYRKTLAGEKGQDFRLNLSAKYYIN
jgi:hypothetical protein